MHLCRRCAQDVLNGTCPNCGATWSSADSPGRQAAENTPPPTKRVLKPEAAARWREDACDDSRGHRRRRRLHRRPAPAPQTGRRPPIERIPASMRPPPWARLRGPGSSPPPHRRPRRGARSAGRSARPRAHAGRPSHPLPCAGTLYAGTVHRNHAAIDRRRLLQTARMRDRRPPRRRPAGRGGRPYTGGACCRPVRPPS